MLETISANDADAKKRVAAASDLVNLDPTSEETIEKLIEAITPQMPPAVATGIVRALADSTAGNVASVLIESWPSMTPPFAVM